MSWKKSIFQIGMIFLFFIPLFVYKYFADVKILEQKTLQGLAHIANTAQVGFPQGSLDSLLLEVELQEDALISSSANSHYYKIHQYLKQIQKINSIQSPIYLLMENTSTQDGLVHFLVTSSDQPYFYHPYILPQGIHFDFENSNYNGPYQDENGIWLSAYSPIPSQDGHQVILQVDKDIQVFKVELQQQMVTIGSIFLGVLIIISTVVIWLNRVLRVQINNADKLQTTHAATGLFNESGFLKQYHQLTSQFKDPGLLLVGISNIEEVRDKLGKESFDDFQQEVINRIDNQLSGENSIFHFGLGEWAVMIENEVIQSEIIAFSQQMKNTYALKYKDKVIVQKVRTFLGYHHFKVNDPAAQVIAKAEIALRKHRQSPAQSHIQFTEKLDQDNQMILELEADIPEAIRQEQFEVYYQAKVNSQGELGGAEALLRWHHPQKGLISPGIFIPILEESSLIHEVGAWVLKQVIHDTKDWIHRFNFNHKVSANVSMTQFDHPDFYKTMQDIIVPESDFVEYIELEITESTLSTDLSSTLQTLEHLQEMGLKVSIDDFGTGYSNLHQLIKMPFDTLKIDRSFVMNLPNDAIAQSSSKLVIGLAKSLNKHLVAEGVEDIEQHQWLCDQGVDLIQGFYWSKPVPKAQFEEQFFKTL